MPKKENIRTMFNNIAPSYDKLNHILSLNIDKIWRAKAVRRLAENKPQTILDLACGTGDSTLAIAKALPDARVTGIDISEGMLEVARKKVFGSTRILFSTGDAQRLPYEDSSVDAVMIAFGIRNFEDRPAALKEILRVLRPGGKLLILELSVPQNKVLLAMYKLYFLHILPFIGGLISGNKAAYLYLPNSVLAFPKPEEFVRTISDCGYKTVVHKSLTFGLCRMYETCK